MRAKEVAAAVPHVGDDHVGETPKHQHHGGPHAVALVPLTRGLEHTAVGGPDGLLGEFLHRQALLGHLQIIGDGLHGYSGADFPTVLAAHTIGEDRGVEGFHHQPGIFVVRTSTTGVGRPEPFHWGPPWGIWNALWGGPPGPRPAPWPGRCSRASSGSRGTRADQGVRPTRDSPL